MSERIAKNGVARRVGLAAALCAAALLGPAVASAETDAQEGFWIQVFALIGPQCPVIIAGVECPDGLLRGAELVLERQHRKRFELCSTSGRTRAGTPPSGSKRGEPTG